MKIQRGKKLGFWALEKKRRREKEEKKERKMKKIKKKGKQGSFWRHK